MNSFVSVCIPSYNNGKYIRQTIGSVLSQTYTSFELVIVDDCSTDDTVEVIRSFADPRITLHVNERNLGMHGNWNRALSLCSGKYIKLLCGDDLIYSDCIEKQVMVLEQAEHGDSVMVACRRAVISESGKRISGSFYKLSPGKYTGRSVIRSCVLAGTNLVGEPMAVLFRGDVLRNNKIRLGSNNYLIDLDMYARLLQSGKLLMMQEELAAFRVHRESMTSMLGMRQSAQFGEFIRQTWLRDAFAVKALHCITGTAMHFFLSIARNLIIALRGRR